MPLSFDLLTQPWIPAILPNGKAEYLHLPGILARAHEVRELADPSPLVTVALHRLLLAVLHRTLQGPRCADAWNRLWLAGRSEAPEITAYWARAREQQWFDLFSPKHPFYQCAELPTNGYAVASTKLGHEFASGDSATLFDHNLNTDPPAFTPAQASRLLVALQAFSVCGLTTFVDKADRSAKAAPLVGAAVVMARGESLFATLMLNLHRYNAEDGDPFPFEMGRDLPAWERAAPVQASERRPDGLADLYTWQSRRVRLIPSQDARGQVVIREVVIMKGFSLPDSVERRTVETMLAFGKNERAKPGQDPYPAVRFREDRALWRDSLALVQSGKNSIPKNLQWLSDLAVNGHLDRGATIPVDVLGMANAPGKPAKVDFWRHERFRLPLVYLQDQALQGALEGCLDCAERTAWALGDAVKDAAAYALTGKPYDKLSKVPKGEAAKLAEHLAAERAYWPALEVPFKQLLQALPRDRTPDGAVGVTERRRWCGIAGRTASDAFDQTCKKLGSEAKAQRARAKAAPGFRYRLPEEVREALKQGTGKEAANA